MEVFRIPGFLTRESCAAITDEMRGASGVPANVYGVAEDGKVDPRVRRVQEVVVSSERVATVETALRAKLQQIGAHFQYELDEIEPLQFLHYGVGDFFVAHQDGNTPLIRDDTMHRRVSISIFLNDGYSGGSLLLHGKYPDWQRREDIRGETGTLVAFRSEATHEVTPITAGERYAIVTWLR